jgi:NCS1 family nucleobase:cation symporter-1
VLDKASVNPGLVSLFDFGWFFGLAVAGAYYFATAKRT